MTPIVLVVDDSAVVRASVKFTLGRAGFDVREARDGQDGLQVLEAMAKQALRPAMILTDVNMPNLDGLGFVRAVKATSFRFVPILILTTESQEAKKLEGKAAGAAGWLVKPFQEDQLVAVVRRFVR